MSEKETPSFDPADYLDTEDSRAAYLVDALNMKDVDYFEWAQETVARSRSIFTAIATQNPKIQEWERVEKIWLLGPGQVF